MERSLVVCRQCKTEFTPMRSNQAFCSVACRDAWWAWHYKYDTHKCPTCGTLHHPPASKEVLEDHEKVSVLEAPVDA